MLAKILQALQPTAPTCSPKVLCLLLCAGFGDMLVAFVLHLANDHSETRYAFSQHVLIFPLAQG
jgi:hypothetical protein